jgi:hypothetical protein
MKSEIWAFGGFKLGLERHRSEAESLQAVIDGLMLYYRFFPSQRKKMRACPSIVLGGFLVKAIISERNCYDKVGSVAVRLGHAIGSVLTLYYSECLDGATPSRIVDRNVRNMLALRVGSDL